MISFFISWKTKQLCFVSLIHVVLRTDWCGFCLLESTVLKQFNYVYLLTSIFIASAQSAETLQKSTNIKPKRKEFVSKISKYLVSWNFYYTYLFQRQAWHSFWAGKHVIQKKHFLFGCPHSFPVFEIIMTKFSFKLLQLYLI